MPLKIESCVQLAGTQYDKRAKLSEEQRQAIRILAREGYSHRKLAAMFGVSKRLVQSIITPPARKPAKKRTKEYWSDIKKRYRQRKIQLYKDGKLMFKKPGKTT